MAGFKYPADFGPAALAALLARLGGPRHWRERARPAGLLAGALVIAPLAGGIVALSFAQLQGGLELADVARPRLAVGAAPTTVVAVGVVGSTPVPIRIIPATPTPPPPRAAPVAAAPVAAAPELGGQPTALPSATPSVPSPTATPAAPPSLEPTATPTVADDWQAVLPELDVVWGVDMPRAIALLDAFVARYPEHEPSRDKLYAALVEHARVLVEQGATSDAVVELTRADELLPERGEASLALVALTPAAMSSLDEDQPAPDPAPQTASQTVPPRIPAPVSVASRPPAAPAPQPVVASRPPAAPAPQPVVASRPPAAPPAPAPVVAPRRVVAPPPSPPTPTKMPFVPPGRRQNREEGRDHDSR